MIRWRQQLLFTGYLPRAGHFSKAFHSDSHLGLTEPQEVGAVRIPNWKRRELRLREVEERAPGGRKEHRSVGLCS